MQKTDNNCQLCQSTQVKLEPMTPHVRWLVGLSVMISYNLQSHAPIHRRTEGGGRSFTPTPFRTFVTKTVDLSQYSSPPLRLVPPFSVCTDRRADKVKHSDGTGCSFNIMFFLNVFF